MQFLVYTVVKHCDLPAMAAEEYRLDSFEEVSREQTEVYGTPSAAIYDAAVASTTIEVVRGEKDYLKMTEIVAMDEQKNVMAVSSPQPVISVGGRTYTLMENAYVDLNELHDIQL